MSDDQRPLGDELARLARGYHDPPSAPAEPIWAGVRRSLEEEGRLTDPAREGITPLRRDGKGRRGARWIGPARWAVAAAALLVLGVGLGRWSAREGGRSAPAPPVGVAGAEDAGSPLRMAASQHLSASETFLTVVRADARSGSLDPAVSRWAGSLLSETRLLLDSSEDLGTEVRALLEDLELLLVQVVQASESGTIDEARSRQELELLTRGMDAKDMTMRIEAVLPPIRTETGI